MYKALIVVFVKAAENKEILVKDEPIDPTGISDLEPEEFQPALWELYKLLKNQMQKERFWEIDENYLQGLGKWINELRDIMDQLITTYDWEQ